MSNSTPDDLSSFSMLDLFRVEADSQTAVLIANLLALERDVASATHLEASMRAAHSLKGAARIVNLDCAVQVAHVMEDCFVAAQKGKLTLTQRHIDILLKGVDLLARISQTSEAEVAKWSAEGKVEIDDFVTALNTFLNGPAETPAAPAPVAVSVPASATPPAAPTPTPVAPSPPPVEKPAVAETKAESTDRVLRVTAGNLNRLMGLAGESLVESRWLGSFAESLLRLKRHHSELARSLDSMRDLYSGEEVDEHLQQRLHDFQSKLTECRQLLGERLTELEMYDRRSANLSHRLYTEALACRMRPFADGIQGFPRMLRDLSRSLGKEVKLEVLGNATAVDREVLEKLEAPLTHLLRNAVDHGLETPAERQLQGKRAEGTIQLQAHHSAGMLHIVVADDGRGVDLNRLRHAVVVKKLTNEETAAKLSETELLDFLFLPGFSMKESVTEISGRGVGLDVVQNMVKNVRGTIRVTTQFGHGTRFQLQLPLTLSVLRALLVEVAGEPYAFPLASIIRTLKLSKSRIAALEGRQHFDFDGQRVGLVTAHQVLQRGEAATIGEELPVIVVGNRQHAYGLVVDGFLGERELVVQPLDARLGKIKDVSAGALMEDGSPVLIMDVEDVVRSIEILIAGGRLSRVERPGAEALASHRKRVLVVDDSLTVRELERKLLEGRGYEVEVAVDGMDGWNAVRTGHFNLVVSDVDMPRMDGIELVTLIKKDANTKALPVMIVSYKDREEDRRRGLDAGADYYLTKGSFHDETLVQAVVDLIGEAKT